MPTPDQYPLSPDSVTAIVALTFSALSILLARAPKLSEAWAAIDGDNKRVILFALYITAAIAVMAFQCGMVQACLQANLSQAVNVALAAFSASQVTFVMFGRKPAATEEKKTGQA